MRGDAAPQDWRRWITARLDPLDAVVANHACDQDPQASEMAGKDFAFAAVLIAVVEHPEGPSVIFTRRASTLRKHTGQVAFPGGRCDPGETVCDTALREAQEEIGLDPALVTLAGLCSPYRTGTGYHVTPVLGFVEPGFTLTPNPHEVALIFETPWDFLMDLVNHEEREGEFPSGVKRRYTAITWQDELIWGATAGMVRALHRRLYGAHAVAEP